MIEFESFAEAPSRIKCVRSEEVRMTVMDEKNRHRSEMEIGELEEMALVMHRSQHPIYTLGTLDKDAAKRVQAETLHSVRGPSEYVGIIKTAGDISLPDEFNIAVFNQQNEMIARVIKVKVLDMREAYQLGGSEPHEYIVEAQLVYRQIPRS